jgi:hypothetical protein
MTPELAGGAAETGIPAAAAQSSAVKPSGRRYFLAQPRRWLKPLAIALGKPVAFCDELWQSDRIYKGDRAAAVNGKTPCEHQTEIAVDRVEQNSLLKAPGAFESLNVKQPLFQLLNARLLVCDRKGLGQALPEMYLPSSVYS